MKKYKRGDIREDGMVFLQYAKNCKDGEWWVTPEKFAAKTARQYQKSRERRRRMREAFKKHPKTLKAGDTREDGKVFRSYAISYKNFECWESAEGRQERLSRNKRSVAKRDEGLREAFDNHPKTLKRGEKRSDGMVFHRYSIQSVNFEHWMTEEAFEKAQLASAARSRKMRGAKKSDPMFILKNRLRARLHAAFREQGYTKKTKTHKMLGCSFRTLKKHIEHRFRKGMTWENQDLWHVDHILPLAAATNEKELRVLCKYTNLQPMWATDNLKKGDKYCPRKLQDYYSNCASEETSIEDARLPC